MNSALLRFCALLTMCGCGGFVAAPSRAAEAPDAQLQLAAEFALRADIARVVGQTVELPLKGLERLREAKLSSGMTGNAEVEFALAAVDIGHRLLGAEKRSEAEVFFSAAEKTFDQVLSRAEVPITDKEKALYLRHLAHLRGNFLGKQDQARADIEQAIQLQPEARELQETKAQLAKGRVVPAEPEAKEGR